MIPVHLPTALVLALASSAALPDVPAKGSTAADFAPAGWSVESSVAGDLDGDARVDLVVVLVKAPAGESERPRALLWLHGAERGYALVGSNVGLLACVACLGINGGDGAPVIEIARRVVVIQQEGGSREAYGSTHRLRLEKEGVRLIGLDRHDLDRATAASTSTSVNYLTGLQVEERVTEGGAKTERRRKLAPVPLLALEAVTGYGTP